MAGPRADAVRRKDPFFRSHVDEARLENAEFLLSMGETMENVSRRTGLKKKTLEQVMKRKGSDA